MPTRQLTVSLEGIGLLGPGFTNWLTGQAILAGQSGYVPQATVLPPSTALPPAERRRAGKEVKLALAIGQEAILAKMPFERLDHALFDAPGVVSRKKQLFPAVSDALHHAK